MQKTIDETFLKNRTQQIKKEKEENSKYFKLHNGENKIEIDLSQLPIDETGLYGKRFVYQTTSENNGKKLLLSASVTLDAMIIKCLSEGINPFTLIKTGEGKNTRYEIKEWQKE